MIKMIKPPKLSRSIGEKVNIKTFPGATINGMNHYIQPTMKKQHKLVILHLGTNDVQHKEPEEIVADTKSPCQGIVSQSLSKIAISEIIKRQDPVINRLKMLKSSNHSNNRNDMGNWNSEQFYRQSLDPINQVIKQKQMHKYGNRTQSLVNNPEGCLNDKATVHEVSVMVNSKESTKEVDHVIEQRHILGYFNKLNVGR